MPPTVDECASVAIERAFAAPRTVVFDAWLDPAALSEFMIPADYETVPKVEVDPRPGGKFEIVMRVGDEDLPHRGEYLVLDRPNRLVFSWCSRSAGEGSTVTIDFRELAPDQTHVRLVHRNLCDEKARQDHRQGWVSILETLQGALPLVAHEL